MVMRNRRDGSGPPDDLPPGLRDRFTYPPPIAADVEKFHRPPLPLDESRPIRYRWLADLGRLALLFLAIAVIDLAFLIICLAFLAGSPFTAPGR